MEAYTYGELYVVFLSMYTFLCCNPGHIQDNSQPKFNGWRGMSLLNLGKKGLQSIDLIICNQ